MNNKLELFQAAQATALKLLDVKNDRQKTAGILNDFDELKIDDKHFEYFTTTVGNQIEKLSNLRGVLLTTPAAKPAAKPAAVAATKPAAAKAAAPATT